MFAYGRTYQVTIGERKNGSISPIVQIEPEHHIEMSFVDEVPNQGSSFNMAEIHLFNIGFENISKLSQKNLTVVVRADYEYRDGVRITPSQAQIIYIGDLVNVVHDSTGVDVVSTLICQEGYHTAIKGQLLNDSYIASGTLLRDGFRQILGFMGYASEIRFSGANIFRVKKGFSLERGTLIKSLDYLCAKGSRPDVGVQLTWMFHRDRILIIDRQPKQTSRSFLRHHISRDTIKGAIEVGFDESTVTTQTKNVGVTEVKLRTFLLPQISIGDNIVIEASTDIEGQFNRNVAIGEREFAVVSIGVELGYDGGNWDTIIKGRIIE